MATLAPPRTRGGAHTSRTRSDLRPDIQALRALAVLGVFVYHANPALLSGGLIGVDVFFVLSGYLISSHLFDELERTGSIRLARFWSRRARRLLPASLTVLAATALGVALLVPEALRERFYRDITAAVFYCANWLFASQSVDYFAQAEGTESPVLHFWSLGVEEQLYAFWPLLLLGAWVWAGRRLRPRVALLGAVLVVGVPSFILGASMVAQGDASAYFVTTTRIWEFGAGALVGLAMRSGIAAAREDSLIRHAAAWTGWAVLVAYMVAFRVELGFPGLNAVVPVVATALVIWAGDPQGRWSPSGVLRTRPVQLVGETSYSIYLWHWPVLVLLPFALTARGLIDEPRLLDLRWWQLVPLWLGVVALAWLTVRLVENPVRFSPRVLALSPRQVLAAALAATVVLSGSVQLASAATGRGLDERRTAARAAEDALIDRIVPTAPAPTGGARPSAPPVWDADTCRGPSAFAERACAGFTWPDVIPAVGVEEETAADVAPITTTPGTRSCLAFGGDFDVHDCVYGVAGGTRIALVGDSHAFHWLPAFEAAARRHGLELHLFARSGCPFSEAPRQAPQEQVDGCLAWTQGVRDSLLSGGYRTVVVSSFAGLAFQDAEPAAGFEAAWSPLVASGVNVVVMRDTPSIGQGRWACAQAHPDDLGQCSRPQADALANDDGRLVAAKALDLRVLDLTRYFCADGVCPVAVGGVRVYRDANHMTGTFSLLLAPYLERQLLPLR